MNLKKTDALFIPTYKRDATLFVSGKGSYLYDDAGNAFLDFGTGIAVNTLGHAHPALQKALTAQATKIIHTSNLYFSQPQIDLATLLIKNSFGKRIFFCNSGTEASEATIKFARKWATAKNTDKYHILSFTDGFHGRTYGALSATAQSKFHDGFHPILDGFHYAPFNDIDAAQKILKQHPFAAIIVEPLQGEGGLNGASTKFLQFLRSAADKAGCALIFDEIQCGMGRTGTLWHYQQHKVVPDMMTLAKPLGGGLPLGAVVCNKEIALTMTPGEHGTTFGGNPVACAVGTALLNIVAAKPFLKQVKQKGEYLKTKLIELQKQFPDISTVLGSGLLAGVRMNSDPTTIISSCKDSGLILVKAGHNTVRFIPPLTVKKKEIDKAVKIFKMVLSSRFL